MKFRSTPLAVIAVMTLAVGGIAAAASAAAQASAPDRPAAELVAATRMVDGHAMYDVPTAKAAWAQVSSRFALDLPKGFTMPTTFPVAYENDSTAEIWIETANLDMYVAEQFRCAWLEAGFAGKASKAEVDWALDAYWSLPSIAEFDLTGMDDRALVDSVAKELGFADRYDALYALSCGSGLAG